MDLSPITAATAKAAQEKKKARTASRFANTSSPLRVICTKGPRILMGPSIKNKNVNISVVVMVWSRCGSEGVASCPAKRIAGKVQTYRSAAANVTASARYFSRRCMVNTRIVEVNLEYDKGRCIVV